MPDLTHKEQCWVRMCRLLLKKKPVTRRGGMNRNRCRIAAVLADGLNLQQALQHFGVPHYRASSDVVHELCIREQHSESEGRKPKADIDEEVLSLGVKHSACVGTRCC